MCQILCKIFTLTAETGMVLEVKLNFWEPSDFSLIPQLQSLSVWNLPGFVSKSICFQKGHGLRSQRVLSLAWKAMPECVFPSKTKKCFLISHLNF